MDVGVKTPLIDFFRKGDVARDVRLQAAQGAIATRAHEQMALLVMLTGDADAEVAAAANATLGLIPPHALAAFLARPDVSEEMREFFAQRGVAPSSETAAEADKPMVDTAEGPEIADDEDDEKSAMQRLQEMSVPQKMSRATKGTREERAILVRDPNKLISVAVLSSPKLTDSEVEAIAKMSSVSDEILRIISTQPELDEELRRRVCAGEEPEDAAADLDESAQPAQREGSKSAVDNRNVPEVLRTTARRKVVIDK